MSICIVLGAFGAHGLKRILSADMLAVYQVGIQYHFFHAIGILIIGLLLLHFPNSRLIPVSGWLMISGVILFSLSLYILSLTGINSLGVITPFGGISFLTAWALLAYSIWKEK